MQLLDLPFDRWRRLEWLQDTLVGREFSGNKCHFSRCTRSAVKYSNIKGALAIHPKVLRLHLALLAQAIESDLLPGLDSTQC